MSQGIQKCKYLFYYCTKRFRFRNDLTLWQIKVVKALKKEKDVGEMK